MRKANSKKPRTGILPVVVTVYGIGIVFAFGSSKKQIDAYIKRYKLQLNYPAEMLDKTRDIPGSCYQQGTTALVYLKTWPGPASDYNTLQHEIFHACDLTLRQIGFDLNNASQEAWAYMIGHVTQKVYNYLWKKPRK